MSNTILFVFVLVIALQIASQWCLFNKAGFPGWAAIVPLYNVIILFKVAKMSPWLILLLLVPLVNIIVMAAVFFNIAKNFGKGTGFGLGLVFLPVPFFQILAFGDSKYLEVK